MTERKLLALWNQHVEYENNKQGENGTGEQFTPVKQEASFIDQFDNFL